MSRLDKIVLDVLQKFPEPNDFTRIIEKLSLSLQENEKKTFFLQTGNILLSFSYFQLAIIILNKALDCYLNSKNNWGISVCYTNLGIAYCGLSDFKKAIEYQERALKINENIGDKGIEATCYTTSGAAYNGLGDFKKAIEYHTKSLAIYKKIDNKYGESACYSNLGNAYENLSNFEKAIEYYNKSLAICKEADDKVGEAKCYTNLGNAYMKLGNFDKAIEYYNNSLVINKEISNKTGEAKCYAGLGEVYKEQFNFYKAIEYYDKSSEIFKDIGDKVNAAKCYNKLGFIYRKLSNFNKAIEFFNRLLVVHIETSDKQGESDCYINLGLDYHDLGDFNKAIDYYNRALNLKKKIGDEKGEAVCYGNLGRAYCDLRDFIKAIKYQEKALEIYKKKGYEEGKGKCYTNFGHVYYNTGEFGKAIDYYNKSLEISRVMGDKAEEAYCYSNLSNCYQDRGNFNTAIEYTNKALAIAIDINDKIGEASCYTSRGNIYSCLDDFKKAIEYHKKSLEIHIKIGNKARESICYINLGIAYVNLEDFNKGIEYLNKSLVICIEIGDLLGEAKCYGNLGGVHYSLGNFDKAIEYYNKFLVIVRNIDNKTGEGAAYMGLANCYYACKDFNKAIENYNKALKIFNETGDYNKKKCLEDIGKVYFNKEDFKSAIDFYKEAVNFIEAARKKDIPIEYKRSFWKDNIHIFDNLITSEVKLKNKEEALEYLERGKGRFILDYLITKGLEDKDVRMSPLSFNDIQNLSKKIGKVLVSLRITKEGTYVFILSPKGNFEVLEILDFNAQQLKEILVKFEGNKPVDGWMHRYIIYRNPEIVNQLLIAGKISKEEAKEMLDNRKAKWLNFMENALKVLYQKLIIKIFQNIEKGEKVVIIPNRGLNNFPLHACFYEEEGRKHYLLEDYEITYTPNCNLLDLCYKREKENRRRDSFFGIANPAYPYELVFSEWEVEEISKLFKKKEIYERKEVKERLLNKIDKYGIIHLSTHGIYELGLDFKSRLLLGESGKKVYLTLDEIFEKVKIPNSWLVVLSACETGLIDFVDIADEYIGLQTGFLYAGTPTVIASLWIVDDFSTALIIIRTYKNIFKNKMHKAESLIEAQLWLKSLTKDDILKMVDGKGEKFIGNVRNYLSNFPSITPFTHPYYWSGFQCIGI